MGKLAMGNPKGEEHSTNSKESVPANINMHF
jgi:hypothetical protein